LRVVGYRPLFSGPMVERVSELQFQRPAREVGLAARDATARGIATGDPVIVSTNGTSVGTYPTGVPFVGTHSGGYEGRLR